MQTDPTVRSIAGDKRVSGAGIVYPAIGAHDFFARLMEEPLTPDTAHESYEQRRCESVVWFKPANRQCEYNFLAFADFYYRT